MTSGCPPTTMPVFVSLVDGISMQEAVNAISICTRLGMLAESPAGWVVIPAGTWVRNQQPADRVDE